MAVLGSLGTCFSDGIRTGQVFPLIEVPGIFQEPVTSYDIIPFASSVNRLAAAQTLGAAGYLTLANGGTTPPLKLTQLLGNNVLQLDNPRNITATIANNGGNFNLYVFGYDYRYQPMVEMINIPLNNTGAAVTYSGQKAFAYVWKGYVDGATQQNLSLGVGNRFGLPIAFENIGFVDAVWDNVKSDFSGTVTLVAGTATVNTPLVRAGTLIGLSYGLQPGALANSGQLYTSAIVPNTSFTITSTNNADVGVVNWTLLGRPNYLLYPQDATAPTATTGDVRGTILLGTEPDGAVNGNGQIIRTGKLLTCSIFVQGINLVDIVGSPSNTGGEVTNVSCYGLPQYTRPLF